jgi:poly(3-hydroxybutyrate) depolymerase
MYEPAKHAPNVALLWPAMLAASTGEIATFFAKQFTSLALGPEVETVAQPKWTTPHRVALELQTVQLRDFTAGLDGTACLLCTPFALHGSALCDLAVGHSLVAALRDAGLSRLFVTDWRSASAEMRYLGIDNYLADLNVLVDEIGPPIDLIGLCQGGWMALVYAARFPGKVRKLVLVGAPVDTKAAPSALSALVDASVPAAFHEVVRLGDGLVLGRKILKLWGPASAEAEDIGRLLQSEDPPDSQARARLEASFRDWYAWTVDLPGTFFLEIVEKLYHRNEIASGTFRALGTTIDLTSVRAPLFLLAGRDDEVVAPPQLFAAERLVGTPSRDIRKITADCRHLGLFMGKRVLRTIWPDITQWLTTPSAVATKRQKTTGLPSAA